MINQMWIFGLNYWELNQRERDKGDTGTSVLLDPTTKQQAYEALVKDEIIRPTNQAPSLVENIAVVEDVTNDDDVEIATGKNDIKVQECKTEKTFPDAQESELDRISAGPDGGSLFRSAGQQ